LVVTGAFVASGAFVVTDGLTVCRGAVIALVLSAVSRDPLSSHGNLLPGNDMHDEIMHTVRSNTKRQYIFFIESQPFVEWSFMNILYHNFLENAIG
jgi:hypothetical protein